MSRFHAYGLHGEAHALADKLAARYWTKDQEYPAFSDTDLVVALAQVASAMGFRLEVVDGESTPLATGNGSGAIEQSARRDIIEVLDRQREKFSTAKATTERVETIYQARRDAIDTAIRALSDG